VLNPPSIAITKAAIDFTGYSGGALIPAAQATHDTILANAATFPNLPTSMADLQTLITTGQNALVKKASRAIADTAAFNVARQALENALSGIGNYVNIVADGDETVILKSGFPSFQTGFSPDFSPPAAPTNLVLRHGNLSGVIVTRYRPQRTPSLNEVQTCTADPNVEVNWKTAGMFSGGKASIPGLNPGVTVWVRARTAGLKGVMRAWSEMGKIMVV
jgi:hypothetical protein